MFLEDDNLFPHTHKFNEDIIDTTLRFVEGGNISAIRGYRGNLEDTMADFFQDFP